MTDLQYIWRIFVPTSRSRLKGQAAQRELHLIRRNLHFKVRSKARLTPVERHIIRNFPQLKNQYFAPSPFAVLAAIARAFLKPALVCASAALVISYAAQGAVAGAEDAEIGPVDHVVTVAAAPIETPIDLPQLAMTLAEDRAPGEFATATLAAFKLPEIPAPQAAAPPAPPAEDKNFAKLEAEAYMKQQRNLVRFISGIIAAFRPTIKDSGLIARHIVELGHSEGVDPIYIAAVIAVESRFSSTAESSVGALGLMQLMPTTAKEVAKSKGHRTAHLVDPKTNIKLGISYLKQLEDKYRGNRFLALSAYNWGPANVDKSRGKYRRIPGSVRKYSNTVLERTLAWRRHFDRATESADSLQTVSRDGKANNS